MRIPMCLISATCFASNIVCHKPGFFTRNLGPKIQKAFGPHFFTLDPGNFALWTYKVRAIQVVRLHLPIPKSIYWLNTKDLKELRRRFTLTERQFLSGDTLGGPRGGGCRIWTGPCEQDGKSKIKKALKMKEKGGIISIYRY